MESMRLQKYLARAGVASRRASEELILAGRVCVNGAVASELGVKVEPGVDEVRVDGNVVELEPEFATIMLHKPLGYVTTMKDEHAAHVVAELVPCDEYPGLFPLGRLDRDTSGLLLFSTDGELGHALLRPRGHVTKFYVALVEGVPTKEELQQLRDGVMLDDGPTLPAQVELLHGAREQEALRSLEVSAAAAKRYDSPKKRGKNTVGARSVVRLGIHEGRNRQVRRMLGKVGHPVVALHRESFGPLELGSLPRGEWRVLSNDEVNALRTAVQGCYDEA